MHATAHEKNVRVNIDDLVTSLQEKWVVLMYMVTSISQASCWDCIVKESFHYAILNG